MKAYPSCGIDNILIGHPVTRTLIEIIAASMLFVLTGCQVYKGEILEEGKYVESGFRVLGTSLASSRERILSQDEFEEKLKREAEQERLKSELAAIERERLFNIESKEKRRRVLLIMSVVSYVLAIGAIVAGVLLKGYKMFGILSGVLMLLGTAFLSLVTTIHILSWLLVAVVIAGVLRLMYIFRDKGTEA